jgi:hypothetical protein
MKLMIAAALTAAFFLPAHAADFKIAPPHNVARLSLPCWQSKQVTEAFRRAEFDAVVQGLLVKKTDPTRSLMTVWLHHMTGRGAVVISHPSGEECIALVVDEAQ